MNLKTNLTCLSILMVLVLNSNQIADAQTKTVAIIPMEGNRNKKMDIFKLQVENMSQYNLCFGPTTKHTLQKFHSQIMTQKLVLKESVKKYYAGLLGRNSIYENKMYLSDASSVLPGLSYEHFVLNQDPGKHVESKEFYLNKAKNQNTTAWILLGGGTAMAIIGAIGFDANFDIWSSDNAQANRADFFGFMLLTGVVADIVSIPFFIGSHHNKKIASIISLDNRPIHSPLINSYRGYSNPTLTLKVNF